MRKLWSVLLCAGLLLSPAFAQQTDEQQEFEQYKSVLKTDAIDAGFGRQFVENVFATIYYRATVVKADKNQPETKITLDKYLKPGCRTGKLNRP